MTTYARFTNNNNIVTIDDTLKAYVYLGKFGPIDDLTGQFRVINFTCAGYPIVYIDVPYGLSYAESNSVRQRWAVWLVGLVNVGGNNWQAKLGISNPSFTTNNPIAFGGSIRVFGRLDLNFPNGLNTGVKARFRVRNASSQLLFDSELPMHRLAGNTYDMEIVLKPNGPTEGPWTQYDTNTVMPFNMQNKAFNANGRGLYYQLEYVGQYNDGDTGQVYYQYNSYGYGVGYWSNGSTLVARKIPMDGGYTETLSPPAVIDTGGSNLVYTRVSVIDTTQFN